MNRIWSALKRSEQANAGDSSHALNTILFPPPQNGTDVSPKPESVRTSGADRSSSDTEIDNHPVRVVRARCFDRIIYHTDPESPGADRFRLLRVRLRSLWAVGLRNLLITSALPQDGKSTVSLNLATALAEHGAKRVLLIEADLHRGAVEQQLGLAREAGMAECLQDALTPHSALRRVEPLGWYFLSRGKSNVPNPTDLLRPQEFSAILHALKPHFDWVLVDSPPVLALTDALSISQTVDGSLLVARAGRTPTKAIGDAVSLLGRKNVVGLVLNGIENQHQPYSRYSTYYRSSKGDEG